MKTWRQIPYIIMTLVMLVVVVFSVVQMGRIAEKADDTGTQTIEKAIRKAAVQCYALEGSYPPDIEWLEQHYGLSVNQEKYFIVYRAVASNLMPEIEVLIK